MSVHDAVSEYRLRLVAVIEASENKRAACAQAGIHHSTFYRWRNQPGGHQRRVSWLERHLGERIVAAALGHPGDGPRRLVDHLAGQGVVVSASKVWRTLVKHRLNTRALRYLRRLVHVLRVFALSSGGTGRRPGRGVRPLSRPVLDREVDGFEYLVEFLVDLSVPEAHHSEAL